MAEVETKTVLLEIIYVQPWLPDEGAKNQPERDDEVMVSYPFSDVTITASCSAWVFWTYLLG